MCHDGSMEGFCLQPTDFYICKCLFDEMVKIKFSQLRCHGETAISLTNQSLAFLRQRTVLRRSCAGAFMIMDNVKKICSHFKAGLNIDDKTKVSLCVKCLRIAISRHFYVLDILSRNFIIFFLFSPKNDMHN